MKRLTRGTWLIGALALVMLSLSVSSSMATDTWWTPWYDRDNPSGTGDWETRSGHGDVCFGNSVINFEAQTLSGTPANQTGETFYSNNQYNGLICRKVDQTDNTCLDYRVRYLCKGNEEL